MAEAGRFGAPYRPEAGKENARNFKLTAALALLSAWEAGRGSFAGWYARQHGAEEPAAPSSSAG